MCSFRKVVRANHRYCMTSKSNGREEFSWISLRNALLNRYILIRFHLISFFSSSFLHQIETHEFNNERANGRRTSKLIWQLQWNRIFSIEKSIALPHNFIIHFPLHQCHFHTFHIEELIPFFSFLCLSLTAEMPLTKNKSHFYVFWFARFALYLSSLSFLTLIFFILSPFYF